MERDLTISEVLVDPLIAQLRQADDIGYAAFAQLMESAARVHMRRLLAELREDSSDAFYRGLDSASSRLA